MHSWKADRKAVIYQNHLDSFILHFLPVKYLMLSSPSVIRMIASKLDEEGFDVIVLSEGIFSGDYFSGYEPHLPANILKAATKHAPNREGRDLKGQKKLTRNLTAILENNKFNGTCRRI